MKPYEIVDRVSEILSTRGRCKWTPEDGDGRVCLGRALVVAITGVNHGGDGRANADRAYRDHPARLAICGAVGVSRLAHLGTEFNDKPDTTDAMVFDALARAAESLRKQKRANAGEGE